MDPSGGGCDSGGGVDAEGRRGTGDISVPCVQYAVNLKLPENTKSVKK